MHIRGVVGIEIVRVDDQGVPSRRLLVTKRALCKEVSPKHHHPPQQFPHISQCTIRTIAMLLLVDRSVHVVAHVEQLFAPCSTASRHQACQLALTSTTNSHVMHIFLQHPQQRASQCIRHELILGEPEFLWLLACTCSSHSGTSKSLCHLQCSYVR